MIRIGIFFGGPSREREISFAGGRTVYDNLDKGLFDPVPIFVDSLGKLILLDWPSIYKGSIRDFYPPAEFLPDSPHHFQVYVESLQNLDEAEYQKMAETIGRPIRLEDLPTLIDFAFLALHGEMGEDGQIQGILDYLEIPYTGSGIRASALGMDKAFQKKWLHAAGFPGPQMLVIPRPQWHEAQYHHWWEQSAAQCGWPLVVRPAHQGSSIGVSIIAEKEGLPGFVKAVNEAFFFKKITREEWQEQSAEQRVQQVRQWSDIRTGLGFPLDLHLPKGQTPSPTLYHPEQLLEKLNHHLGEKSEEFVLLEAHQSEQEVVVESFIQGKEFSCIVLRMDDYSAVALPPTEIIKGSEVFDYRSKYLPGLSRKETPIQLPEAQIEDIRTACVKLFHLFEFNTYARIDGFITASGIIYLNDPNTTSGMLPASFFFHQAAEIGLNPSQFLTYLVRISLQERLQQQQRKMGYAKLLQQLDQALEQRQEMGEQKTRVAVIMGGYSFERHISMESGRNVYEKLASSGRYHPVPVFLAKAEQGYRLYRIPISLMLKDNADDIRDKLHTYRAHPVIERIKQRCAHITERYASEDVIFEPLPITLEALAEQVDLAFIALHGRPGEDGHLQADLERVGLPYNGSGPDTSAITIHKYNTLQRLQAAGFSTTAQALFSREDYQQHPTTTLREIEQQFSYPMVLKPVDDGCSSAVKVIRTPDQLSAYLEAIFRQENHPLSEEWAHRLSLSPREEFPAKAEVLVEALITRDDADRFLEITGGLLTHREPDGSIRYEMFEPSEALAGGEVLTLEEKFLAGEGQNLTPARFTADPENHAYVSRQVRDTLEQAARLLGVEGYARIDAFVRVSSDLQAETIIIEVNSLPGMTPATAIFHQAALSGYKPWELIDGILGYAKGR